MKHEDMKILFNYLKDKTDLNDELKNMVERMEIVVKQLKVQEQFSKDMEALNQKLAKLNSTD